jgi:hypothetical protein
MSDYIPQVGDRIRLRSWGTWIDVKFIDDGTVFGRYGDNGTPNLYALDLPWIKVEKPRPLPERWLTIDGNDRALTWDNGSAAAGWAQGLDRCDIYRVWSDADGTPHVERVTP